MGATSLLQTLSKRNKLAFKEKAEKYHAEQGIPQLLDALPLGIQENNLTGKITYSNKAHHQLLGIKAPSIIGSDIWDFYSDEEQKLELKNYLNYLISEQPEPTPYITQCTHQITGKPVTLEINWEYQRNQKGELTGFISVIADITDRLKEQQTAIKQTRLIEAILCSTAEAIYGLDMNGCCVFANPRCLELLGYESCEQLLGKNMHQLIHHTKEDGTPYPADECPVCKSLKSGKEVLTSIELLWRADGSSFTAEYWSYPIHIDNKMCGTVVSFIDITERKKEEEKVLHQAHFDPLTDLPNRTLSLNRLNEFLKSARHHYHCIAVLFLDLDDFKKINDTLGHETGDKLLITAAKRLRHTIRSSDMVGRLGGDEFIILLHKIEPQQDLQPIIAKLLSTFREPFLIDNRELRLTTSIGVACYPQDGTSASELLRNADVAMYHAKEQGRNTCACFTDAMNRAVSRRMEIEARIHEALQRNEFSISYQPQFCVRSQKLISAEALLRWHNPELGFISPTEFIPIAEQNGAIIPIGEFVIIESLRLLQKMQKDCKQKLRIAINLSPIQFRSPHLVSFIGNALNDVKIEPQQLELEITEGVLLSGHRYVKETLTALKTLGITLAMDDFGTGYSSLSYLRQHPFDVVKIDRTFINDINNTVADRVLINAIIVMAHALGIKIVAEGVETAGQLQTLQQLDCDMVQGYLLGKPMPSEEYLTFIRENICKEE